MELLILITISTFFLLWNVLAVVGLIVLIVKLAKVFSGKKAPKKGKISGSQKAKKKQKQRIPIGIHLLNAGVILLWFSTLFLGFSRRFIEDPVFTKFYLFILLIVHYGSIYLLSLKKITSSTKKLALKLTYLSIIFFGLRYWTKNLSGNVALRGVDYFMIFGAFMTAVSYLYHKALKSRAFFSISSLLLITTAVLTVFSIIGNPVYRFPIILSALLCLYLIVRAFLKKHPLYEKRFLPIMRFSVLLIGILHIVFVVINQLSIDTVNETMANIIGLAIPLLFSIVVRILDKRGITLIVEGLFFPYRAVLIGVMLILSASSYLSWTICLILFIAGAVFSFTHLYKNASVRRFLFPMMLSSLVLSIFYMLIKPFYIENFDPFAIGITLLVLQVVIATKSAAFKFRIPRLIEPVLQISGIIALLYSLDLNYSTNVFNQNSFALILVIPATIYLVEMLLSKDLDRAKYVVFNALLLLCMAVILSVTSPVLGLFIGLYSLIAYIIVGAVYHTPLIGFPMVALSLISVTALCKVINLGGVEVLILNGVTLVVFGNIWRVLKLFKCKNEFVIDLFHDTRRTAILTGAFMLLYSFVTIHYTDHTILLVYAVLSILFLTAPTKNSKLRLISGIGLVLTFWHLLNISDTPKNANAQLYAFPVVILTLFAAVKAQKFSKIVADIGLFLAISLPMNIALLQSIFDPHPYNLVQGILLLFISTSLVVYGTIKKKKLLKYFPPVYFVMGLLVIWSRYYVYIPWWLYPTLLGIVFVALSVKITLGISDGFSEK